MDAAHNEYLAAIAGIHDQTPRSRSRGEPAVGDFVSGMTCGKRWSGHVMACDRGWLAIECDGAWLSVSPADIPIRKDAA
jgi:hypothetical protein